MLELKLPDLGENIASGDVVKLLVAVGDHLSENQPVLELETDKAVIEVPSSLNGTIREIHVKEGDKVAVGQTLLGVEGGEEGAGAPAAAPAEEAVAAAPAEGEAEAPPRQEPPAPPPAAPARTVAAAPSVRRLARELGVDIAQVRGSGPGGRISRQDLKEHVRRSSEQGAPAAPALPDFGQWGPVERRPMGNVRRVTAERLAHAWATIPHVTQFDQADVTELEKTRRQFARRVEAAGGKLTPAAIVLKVAAAALKVFPQFNASIDMAGREIIYKQYCHIGVAVDTERGLLVPVVREVDRKNLVELCVELGELADRARQRRLKPGEMQGGCFTVSNLGSIGGGAFAPIINPPEVAILGVARSRLQPVYIDGSLQPRLLMPLALSYDHRLIDGADGARFLRWIVEALEHPFLLALEG